MIGKITISNQNKKLYEIIMVFCNDAMLNN